jgi:hypothetical protein
VGFIIALVVLILCIVFWVAKTAVSQDLYLLLIGLLAVAILVGGYGTVQGWIKR